MLSAYDADPTGEKVRAKMERFGFKFVRSETAPSGWTWADPHYWVRTEHAVVVWQWEHGEPAHPAWIAEMERPGPLLPDGTHMKLRWK